MLEILLKRHKLLQDLFKKLEFLRDNFNFNHSKPFYDELVRIGEDLKLETDYHFYLQDEAVSPISNETKKLVKENMLVRDILLRMLNRMIEEGRAENPKAFQEIGDIGEILSAYLKKERGLFRQQLEAVTTPQQRAQIDEILKVLEGKELSEEKSVLEKGKVAVERE
ncbi:MAG: hypothetical protein ABGW77_05565 [Campylobacterales bacterium]